MTEEEEDWTRLIDSEESRKESRVQAWLERHPWFVPGAHTLDTNSGHPPWPGALITQPPLPDLSTKRPDFMWLANDSAFLYPVLIEIETPWKRWFHQDGQQQHADLTTALSQVANWQVWFGKGRNQVNFCDQYRVPRALMDLTLRPRYVVIHGRRNEASATPATAALRGRLAPSDVHLMTFDRLAPDQRARGYLTVSIRPEGYVLHENSPQPGPRVTPYARQEIAGVGDMDSPEPQRGYRFRPPQPRN
jgi:hypothetical protein